MLEHKDETLKIISIVTNSTWLLLVKILKMVLIISIGKLVLIWLHFVENQKIEYVTKLDC